MIINELRPREDYIYIRALTSIRNSLDRLLPPASLPREYLIAEPPENIDADFSYPLSRERVALSDQEKIAKEVSESLSRDLGLSATVQVTAGYLNIKLDSNQYTSEFFREFSSMGDSYGTHGNIRLKIVVEHTSANPVHPLHLGHARNSCLGDTLARLLRFYGTNVETRFYVDDVGRQIAVLVYGLSKLLDEGKSIDTLSSGWKIDHWIGKIYALTNLLVEMNALKKELKNASDEKYRELIGKQDELVGEIARLRDEVPEAFEVLSSKIMQDEEPEKEIARISILYERGDRGVASQYRHIIEKVLQGFKETLERMNVKFDKWDWESDLIWNGEVERILSQARRSPIFSSVKGSEGLDFSLIINEKVKIELNIPKEMEIPPLVLKRSDGTTLYPTRDIAYSIFKFKESKADYVINVVGKEQMLPQAQIRLALYALGYPDLAKRLIHYSYEMVNLKGFKMSGRRGRYITVDELIQKAEEMAKIELERRNRNLDENQSRAISEKIGIGAVRQSLVSISADKPITINLEDIINFEKNTGPYLQYTYARASSLLRKAEEKGESFAGISEDIDPITWRIIRKESAFPYIIYKSAKELKPEILVAYLGELAQMFNKWYDTVPVLSDPEPSSRRMKLQLVASTRAILKNSLYILGIEPLEKI